MLSILAWLLKQFILLYSKTFTIEIKGLERTKEYLQEQNTIFLIWHGDLFFSTFFLDRLNTIRPLNVLISKSRDGNFASHFAERFSNMTVTRVGHLAKAQALRTTCILLQNGSNLLITPDGPRGPQKKIKAGAIFASQKTSSPLIPIVISCSSQWTLSSWDSFRIPKPFSSVTITFLEPIICNKEKTSSSWQNIVESKIDKKI